MDDSPALGDGAGRGVSTASRTAARWAATLLVGGAGLAVGMLLLGQQAVHFFTAGSVGSDRAKLDLGPLATRSVVYAADGTEIGIFHDEEYRVPVPLAQIMETSASQSSTPSTESRSTPPTPSAHPDKAPSPPA